MNLPSALAACLRRYAFVAACVLLCIAPRAVLAQTCTFTMSNIAFGNVSTITGSPVDATGTLTANCSGIAAANVEFCLSIGIPSGGFSPRTMTGPGGATLSYDIFTDSAHTTIWGSVASSSFPERIVDIPVVGGIVSVSLTVYGRVYAGQTTVQPGSYSQAFATTDTLYTYLAYNGTPPTCTGSSTPSDRLTFNVSATVIADCTISAAPLAFPTMTTLSTQVTANSSLSVTCVSGAPYTVALNAGTTAGGTVASRLMLLSGGTATVNYELYKDAAFTQPWGDGTNGTATDSGTGTGAAQTLTVFGRVPAQTVPPSGNYSDTVTATVTF
ncbi:Csu type fimbrial protein [Paraburkholderia bannensis]|uniref:Csu type fimbrial protein n=1 Tax=Paraburkholderia bannensis TaxID=765414 RepID=UPI0005A8B6C5|nr:spore coat protein U domain-containing protein [Paraburkholderia bannensis]